MTKSVEVVAQALMDTLKGRDSGADITLTRYALSVLLQTLNRPDSWLNYVEMISEFVRSNGLKTEPEVN